MDLFTLLLIAVGLSMDSFAVSVSNGFSCNQIKIRNIIYCSLVLALTQGTFTLVGWALGINFLHLIEDYDHWIAFTILIIIGSKMLYEGIFVEDKAPKCYISLASMLLLGAATSIDAFFIGIGLAFLQTAIIYVAIIIALVTFLFALSGHFIGRHFGRKHSRLGEIAGGVILIGIGIKIIIEHLG